MSRALGGFSKRALKKRLELEPESCLLEVVDVLIPKGKSIIDIGAGNGRYIKALRDLGYTCSGLDGSEDVETLTQGLVVYADISQRLQQPILDMSSDWGLFLEVGEHIPRDREEVVISNVSSLSREGILVSWARPGQRGRGHVNCRTMEYIVSSFAFYGWKVDDENTLIGRSICKKVYDRLIVLRKTRGRHVD